MDDKQRYEVFKIRQGRCQDCGTRLKWEAYEVPGLSGGWVIREDEDKAQALCYKCAKFIETNNKKPLRLEINEANRPASLIFGQDDAPEEAPDLSNLEGIDD